MSQFSDLDDWLNNELAPQLPPSRTLQPAYIIPITPTLIGYIRLWHIRTCDHCGSEHKEFMAFYACYRTGSGAKIVKALTAVPEDTILPVLDQFRDVTTLLCADCAPPIIGDPAVLTPYTDLLTV